MWERGMDTQLNVQYEVNGLVSFRETREASHMPVPHSHNEIEILLIEQGGGTWLMGGEKVTFKPGRLIVFWALRPHQLLKSDLHTVKNCLTVPMAVFQGWGVPDSLSQLLLAGNVLLEPDREMFDADVQAFHRWHEELRSNDPGVQKLALLEIRARLGRLGIRVQGNAGPGINRLPRLGLIDQESFHKVAQVADYVAKHFKEPITVGAIGKHIGMHPSAATRAFKKLCGITMVQYVTQHRILHAQSLLAATDMKISDVGLESGYHSGPRFHAAFREICGISPNDFREAVDFRKVPLEVKGGCSAGEVDPGFS
jgi:AraC-like DNA-binding protein